MLLAAGEGRRMRPLTERVPKALAPAAGRPLIEWQLRRLRGAGIREVVVNLAHLGEQIAAHCGDGSRWGMRLRYSREAPALETGGGVCKALGLLGEAPFIVLNADSWSDYPLRRLAETRLGEGTLAHLVMADNPPENPGGDFHLGDSGFLAVAGTPKLTFTGTTLMRPELLAGRTGAFPLAEPLRAAMAQGAVSAECWDGRWLDVGTVERLETLDRMLRSA